MNRINREGHELGSLLGRESQFAWYGAVFCPWEGISICLIKSYKHASHMEEWEEKNEFPLNEIIYIVIIPNLDSVQ